VRVCAEWLNDSDAFVLWALKNGYVYYPDKPRGEQLSIDRIDPKRNYMPCNCRWIPQRQNCGRTRPANQEALTARSHKFARMFSNAADFCWGRWRIDWKKVRDEYMNGDTSTLVNFLKAEGYCSMAIYHIRKRLGDVIPQRKSERGK